MTLASFHPKASPAQFQPRASDFPRGNTFTRSLTASVIASMERRAPSEIAARMWPNDRITPELLERAASAPAMMTVPGWAQELAQIFVSDALNVLCGCSVGAQLLRETLVVAINRAGTILVPGLAVDATGAGFVAEGAPIPVHQLALTPAQVQPKLLASIAVLTREMIESSNAEVLVSDALMRAAGLALDTALFDINPATAARPAGLRNGIAALTASASPDITEAYFDDISALIGAVAVVSGCGPYILVGSPQRAFVLQMRFIRGGETPTETKNTIMGSSALGNDLMAVAPMAVAGAVGTDPAIETATASTLHMETVPLPVGSATPSRSLWQTDSIAIKMRWVLSWALRDVRGVAWLTPTWK
jgi:hypothetical protein